MSSSSAIKRVCGFIGLGSQGAPIARRMMGAGYPLVLWARRSETLLPFRDTRATFASSIEELGHAANHVGICVVGDAGVLDVCDRVIACARSGSTIAIHSTVLPETCETLEHRAQAKGVLLVDAPVSGGKPAADAGKLTVMVGGERQAVEAMTPIFDTFSNLQIHLGSIGAGQKTKLINNSLMMANMGLVHAAACAGYRLEIDRDQLMELLRASSGKSFALDVYARHANIADFQNVNSLIEKIELLGKVLGTGHEAYQLLLNSASQIRR